MFFINRTFVFQNSSYKGKNSFSIDWNPSNVDERRDCSHIRAGVNVQCAKSYKMFNRDIVLRFKIKHNQTCGLSSIVFLDCLVTAMSIFTYKIFEECYAFQCV